MPRFIAAIFGRAGYGKTTFINEVLPVLPRPIFIIDTMNEFNEGLVFYSAAHLVEFLRENGRNDSRVYTVKTDSETDAALFFSIFPAVRKSATIVIDEVSKFCSPNSIDDNLKQIINYGRHWNQSLVMAARRSAEVHRDVTAQADVTISFRQTESRDIAKMRELYDGADELATLERGEFVAIGDAHRVPFESILRARSKSSSAMD